MDKTSKLKNKFNALSAVIQAAVNKMVTKDVRATLKTNSNSKQIRFFAEIMCEEDEEEQNIVKSKSLDMLQDKTLNNSSDKFADAYRVIDPSEDVDTGIQHGFGKTSFSLMDGFCVSGDYLIFVTLDIATNNVFLEVFQNLEVSVKKIFQKKLCTRGSFECWTATSDP